jgi:hypothetical protein
VKNLPTQVSTVAMPPAPAALNLGVEKGEGGAETLPQQVMHSKDEVYGCIVYSGA